jgi:DNA polymerase-3 subunit epsilon
MIRQVVLDTETTGISHQMGHRIIEIGCIELINRQLTNRHFHAYLNPDREVDEGAFRVHGISSAFLKDKPRFKDVVSDFIDFIKGSELIIHNAVFDVGFIDAELSRLKHPQSLKDYATVFDTLIFAREKHRGARNNLDALCKRYHVDNSGRQYHGALLDADILASVYLAMTGGQIELFVEPVLAKTDLIQHTVLHQQDRLKSSSPVMTVSKEELAAHEAFLKLLGRVDN